MFCICLRQLFCLQCIFTVEQGIEPVSYGQYFPAVETHTSQAKTRHIKKIIVKPIQKNSDVDLSDKNVFLETKKTLDTYRYQNALTTKNEILGILRNQVSCEIVESVEKIIDKECSLFDHLEIYYHDTQHTLEVTLGTTRIVGEAFRAGVVSEEEVLLAIVAALFHD